MLFSSLGEFRFLIHIIVKARERLMQTSVPKIIQQDKSVAEVPSITDINTPCRVILIYDADISTDTSCEPEALYAILRKIHRLNSLEKGSKMAKIHW